MLELLKLNKNTKTETETVISWPCLLVGMRRGQIQRAQRLRTLRPLHLVPVPLHLVHKVEGATSLTLWETLHWTNYFAWRLEMIQILGSSFIFLFTLYLGKSLILHYVVFSSDSWNHKLGYLSSCSKWQKQISYSRSSEETVLPKDVQEVYLLQDCFCLLCSFLELKQNWSRLLVSRLAKWNTKNLFLDLSWDCFLIDWNILQAVELTG